jgi:ribosomal protein S18 acetylase RimI-like enzyme
MDIETTLGTAENTNAHELARLINSAYRAHDELAGWTNESDLLAGTRTDTASLQHVLPGATSPDPAQGAILLLRRKADAALIGCISLEPYDEACCYLSLLAVDPGLQNSGYGRLLLAEAESRARASGARTTRMTVIRQRTELIAWYERRGYRQTGDVVPFPYDDPGVGTPLRDDLQLVVLEKPLTE